MKRSRNAVFACLAALAVAAASGCDSLFAPRYDPDSEGTKENPVELSREIHRGRVGMGGGTLSGSYYSFVSEVEYPTIFYENRSYPDDLDCAVYTDPDFHTGLLVFRQERSEDECLIFNKNCLGLRLYVHIGNYDDEHVVEYDIYYR